MYLFSAIYYASAGCSAHAQACLAHSDLSMRETGIVRQGITLCHKLVESCICHTMDYNITDLSQVGCPYNNHSVSLRRQPASIVYIVLGRAL